MTASPEEVSIGVDVGTGSARAGVFIVTGRMLASCSCEIQTWSPKQGFYEQSSEDIWRACCTAVSQAVAQAKADSPCAIVVVGIGFDATCSLVVLGDEDTPLSVDPEGDQNRNVILWLDHRAVAQAEHINRKAHPLLALVGGAVSPEMEMPKILWLREHMPGTYQRASKFFDLTDYLTYRATGVDMRSLCTLVCKWNYDAEGTSADVDGGGGWSREFLDSIGLGDLGPERVGSCVSAVGAAIGSGLTASAAEDLGLPEGLAVAVGAIDAHAGGIGCLGIRVASGGEGPDADDCADPDAVSLEARLALIAGTSTCHMASSKTPVFVPGVWGPYFSAMVPGYYLNEGGQSAAGKLLDFLIESHAAFPELKADAETRGVPATALLNRRLDDLCAVASIPPALRSTLASSLHVSPDFAGNRSPLADPNMRGAVVGLHLGSSLDDLALLYLAAVQALAYQTRHILEAMEAAGHEPIEAIHVVGGLAKNPLYVREHADALARPLVLPSEQEAVLLGSAMLGATAGGIFKGVPQAMEGMATRGALVRPCVDRRLQAFHSAKYRVYRRMLDDQRAYRELMAGARAEARAEAAL